MVVPEGQTDDIRRIATLGDDVRRRLYCFVVDQGRPVGRDEAAAGAAVPRHTAKFHLDRLVEEGLLEVEFRRLGDRRGPGAGRPAKLYRRSGGTVSVSLPERRYDLAGALLAAAIVEAQRTGAGPSDAVADVAQRTGRAIGEEFATSGSRRRPARLDAMLAALAESGFEPVLEDRVIVLRNCPFHRLAEDYTDLVCAMNLDFVRGLAGGVGLSASARLEPRPGRCCVEIDVG